MPTDIRLKKEKDFNLVFKKGTRVFSSSLTMVYFPSREIKAGFAVSKKHGGSVVRNRIKRLLINNKAVSYIQKIKKDLYNSAIENNRVIFHNK